MRLLTYLSAACLILICNVPSSLSAQKIHLSDFSVFVGGNTTGEIGTFSDFQALAPNSQLLQNNMTGFSNSSGYNSWNSSGRISFMLGFDLGSKETSEQRLSPELRIGLTYTNGISLSGNLWKEARTPYDTLTSSRTGNQTVIDSVNYEGYNMSYNSDNLVLDISLIFRTNPEARWSFYGGIGLMGGMSLSATTVIHHYQNSHIENQGYNTFSEYAYDDETEIFRNDNSFLVSGYIPLGVDFRLGNKRQLWKRSHLFYEVRPSVNFNNIPEIGTLSQGSVHHGFGIRIT